MRLHFYMLSYAWRGEYLTLQPWIVRLGCLAITGTWSLHGMASGAGSLDDEGVFTAQTLS